MVNMVAGGIYAFLLLFVVAIWMAARADYRRTKRNPVFLVVIICVGLWLIADFAILFVPNIELNIFLWNAQLAFLAFAPILMFFIIFEHFLPGVKMPGVVKAILIGIPSASTVITLTANFHSLFRIVDSIVVWPRAVEYSFGPWFYVHAPFTFGVAFACIVLIIYAIVKGTAPNRTASLLFILGMLAIMAAVVIYMINVLTVDINPTSIGAAGALFLVHMAMADNKHGVIFNYFNTLKSRVTFPVLMVMCLMMIAVIAYIGANTNRMVEHYEDDRMLAATASVQAYLRSLERQTFMAASSIGDSAELVRLLAEGDRAAIHRFTLERKEHFQIDEIIISNADGFTIVRSHDFDFFNDDISRVPSVAAALERRFITLYTPTPTADMVMTSTAPIMDGDTFLGAVVVNYVIGRESFLQRIGDTFSVDVTVFGRNGYSIATTLRHPDTGLSIAGTRVHQDVYNQVLAGGQSKALQLNVLGFLPYNAYYFPLPGADELPNGMLFIGIPREYGESIMREQMRNTILMAMFGLVIVSTIMYLLIQKALKPLGSIMGKIKDVAAGNLNINIDRSKITTDEIGMLTQDVLDLSEVIKSIVTDYATVYKEYIVVGNIHYTMDEEKYQNAYKGMVGLINKLLVENTKDILSIAEMLEHIGEGNFDEKIDITEWPGDWAIMPKSLLGLTSHLKDVSAEISEMIRAIVAGDLSHKIDETTHKGDWRKITVGLNSIVSAVDEPMQVLMVCLEQMRAGRFSIEECDARLIAKGLKTDVEQFAGTFKEGMRAIETTMNDISSYVSEIEKVLAQVSAGNLTRTIEINLIGDFDSIKRSVNSIVARLNETVTDITFIANGVSAGSSQLAQNSMDLSEGVTQQMTSIEEMNEGLSLVNLQAKDNSENAKKASDLAGISKNNAEAGNKEMNHLLSAMELINVSSAKISQIIKTIEGIALQTNLLALNAAVEAARAGEHGKGFSVVAEEVRSLAARSADAAKQTEDLIQESINNVKEGKQAAMDTAESLGKIVQNVADVSTVITEILSSSSEQTEAIGGINGGLGQISESVQTSAATSQETAAAAEELDSQVMMLKDKLSFFSTELAALPIKKIWDATTSDMLKPSSLTNAPGKHVNYEPGEVIVKEGDAGAETMYFVLEGNVKVFKGYSTLNEKHLATLKPGDLFGEMALFLNEPRTAHVVADGRATVIEIHKSILSQFMASSPETAYVIIGTLCQRLKNISADY